MVVVKVGKPTKQPNPCSCGKRDSQILLMHYLNHVHFDNPMSPLELEIYRQMCNVIGVDPAIRYAHTMASEPAISNHVTAPELPEPNAASLSNQSQHVTFPTHTSSLSPHSSRFPHFLPPLSANQNHSTYSQAALLATHQAFSAEDSRIAHIGPANIKTWSRHCPSLYVPCAALANHPEAWTDKEI